MSNSMQGSHSGSLTVSLVDPITGMGHNLLFPLLDDSTYLNGCLQILSYSQQSWFSVGKLRQFSSSTVREICAIHHQPGHQMNACPFKSLLYQTNEIGRDCIFPHHQLSPFKIFCFYILLFLSFDLVFGFYLLSLLHGRGLLQQGVGLDLLQVMRLRKPQLGRLLLHWWSIDIAHQMTVSKIYLSG